MRASFFGAGIVVCTLLFWVVFLQIALQKTTSQLEQVSRDYKFRISESYALQENINECRRQLLNKKIEFFI